jgi:uncharacterized Zn-binding protein involved in type VI secretion
MPPAARVTDMHVCPLVTGVVPHVGGPILPPCAFQVLIGGLPAARITDLAVCVGPPDVIVKGSPTVLIQYLPAARMLDNTAHGGMLVLGDFTVIIGDSGSGGGGGGGGAGAVPTVPPVLGALGGVAPGAVTDAEKMSSEGFKDLTKSIKIAGDKEYKEKVMKDLREISSTPTGKKLLQSLRDSGKTVEIRPLKDPDDGNSTGYKNGADRFKGSDEKPGKGTDSIVSYDPEQTTIGDQPWETRPPAIGLGHELIHAEQAANGTMAQGQTNNDSKPDPSDPSRIAQEKKREVEAVGIAPDDRRPFTENKLREEWSPRQPSRPWY